MDAEPDPRGNWFVGLPVTADPGTIERVLAGAPARLRRFVLADLHVTVAFFGRLAAEQVEAVRAALATLASVEVAGFDLVFDSLLLLPSARRPTAIALAPGAGGAEVAGALASQRTRLLAAAGRPPEARPALLHLTIARPPRRSTADDSGLLRAWARESAFPAVPVHLDPPRLYGWSRDRATRQFVIVG